MAKHERLDFPGKRALVMGLGVFGGGAGVARFLAEQGAQVTVTDLQTADRLAGSIESLAGYDIRWVLGEHREEDFETADFIVRNPAVPANSRFLKLAAARGIPTFMEMSLFFMECPSTRIIGVTGTKGKTTTTTLVGEILARDGRDVVVAGNLRVSALDQLKRITPETNVVLELSSFQLEGLEVIETSPQAAVITNLMADHLNRYPSLDAYFEAKCNIFRYQDSAGIVALNRDDAHTAALVRVPPGQVVWFGRDDDVPGAERSQLSGLHNHYNMAAAAAITGALGVQRETIAAAIGDFSGVPYRLELIREIDRIQFVNDSAATTPDATLAALEATERPVVLIAGGADKGLTLSGLAQALHAPGSRVKAVVLLEGSATDKVAAAAGHKAVGRYGSMREAVQRARRLAVPGDTVLLSPACASFGLFANEFERGDQFVEAVRAL